MLKFVAPLLTLAFIASTANALEFELSDNSQFTKACVAAVESNSSLEDVLRDNNIRALSKDEVLCNDTPIAEFARTYKSKILAIQILMQFSKIQMHLAKANYALRQQHQILHLIKLSAVSLLK